MTTFWIIAGLLLAGALLFVLPPLLSGRRRGALAASQDEANVSIYRDQLKELEADLAAGTIPRDQYEQAKREVESRLLDDVSGVGGHAAPAARSGKLTAIVVGVAVPILAVSLYSALGNPKGLDPKQVAAAPAAGQQHEVTPDQIQQMVAALAAKLKDNPDNVEGWVMLARSYTVLERFPEAAQAYAKVVDRIPDNGQVLADYADTLAMAQGGGLRGEPERLIARALKADPNNIKALALAGTVEFDKKNYAGAVERWEQALAGVPPESQFAQSVKSSIAEAKQLGGIKTAAQPAKAPVATVAGAGGTVTGTVQLSPALAAKAAPTDTVFVFARAATGPRMPLAIVRKQVKDLPVAFTLDDSMAMAPNMKLSSFPQVVVGARVSKTGNATPQAGDLEGLTQPVAAGASGLVVTIDAEVK